MMRRQAIWGFIVLASALWALPVGAQKPRPKPKPKAPSTPYAMSEPNHSPNVGRDLLSFHPRPQLQEHRRGQFDPHEEKGGEGRSEDGDQQESREERPHGGPGVVGADDGAGRLVGMADSS